MKKILIPLFYVMLILSSTLLLVRASTLNLTVTTNKQSYNRYDQVQISGILTQDGSAVTDSLVAIQVVDSRSNYAVTRTVNTGQNPQTPLLAEVNTVYSSDAGGNPVSTVAKNGLAYFTGTVSNYDLVTHTILVTINIYDSANVVLSAGAGEIPVPARSTAGFMISAFIPPGTASGTAVVFADAYTAWPNAGGVPYCPEISATFNINSPGGSPPSTPSGNQGAYGLVFKLPQRASVGSYTVYTSSAHDGTTASQSTAFTVAQPGDFNGDAILDFSDTTAYVKNYIKYNDQQTWNPVADLDHDGDVDFVDTTAYVKAYIIYWSG
jgi:hypothetical protein